VLEGKKPNHVQGNLLMDYLLGAEVHFAATREEQRQMLDDLAEQTRKAGGRPAYSQRQSHVRYRLGGRPIWKQPWKCWSSWMHRG
jgi:1-aminocyclopropane-1-carboxylate deaminase/D-cysteine desulfhydrase-like pyridoxal-dependent ACC family enzyme